MGFLCINKEEKKNVDQKGLAEEKFLRDIGLDNVNNINPEINACREIFLSPLYYVQGAVELYSGLTATLTGCTTGTTGIYNLDYTGDINIDFVITGGTEYTGYTGSFCLKVFSDQYFKEIATNKLIDGSEITNYCVDFSGITGTTITKQYLEGTLAKNWSQYLIRPYYIFESKECNSKKYFNSWQSSVQLNVFQKETDYYFMTVVDPPTPLLQPPDGGTPYQNGRLITDSLLVNGSSVPLGPQALNGSLNYFKLSSIPANGTILLVLNGVQLTQDFDFKLINQGFGSPIVVEVFREILPTDWLLATYIAGIPNLATTSFGNYWIDTILLDGFTTTTTPSYRASGDNTINYNGVSNKYEFFTTYPVDDENSIMLTVNGVKLAMNQQYFLSTSFPGRIIFNENYTSFNLGDVISVLYITKKDGANDNDYGSLKKNTFTTRWSVPTTLTNPNVTGRFIVEAFNQDINLLTHQLYVDYVEGQSNYETTFNSLSLNVNYKFKVTFEATYVGYLNNKVITCSSAEGYFDTKGAYINNTY